MGFQTYRNTISIITELLS